MFSLMSASASWAARCEDLVQLTLPNTRIESASLVGAGSFVTADKIRHSNLPAFCRVLAQVRAAPDSDIAVEIWLPTDHWTGVFHGAGNGGYAGSMIVGHAGMEAGLRRGYATATTDMGTAPATVLNGDALIGHPQKWKDWGLLSTHVMSVTGKAIVRAFYGEGAKRSYFTGCSTGGQQGLIEAMFYPEDYDGILVGAPVVSRTWGHAAAVWDYRAANLEPDHRLSDAKLALLHNAVLAACGGLANGLPADPFVSDPSACTFDPTALTCGNASQAPDSNACLTPAEVQTAEAFYKGPSDRTGKPVYYGWALGSEAPGPAGWTFTQTTPEPAFDGLFKWVFGADWNWRTFDLDRDMPKVDAALGPALNGATRGDMGRFRARGGKLILYQGWADTLVAPAQTIALYGRLTKEFGRGRKPDFARLFMAPGVMHCGGGAGPSAFNAANGDAGKPPAETPQQDLFAALSRWVEDGAAPARVIATRYVDGVPAKGVAFQRPLCAYPNKAWYKGAGDTTSPDSFMCALEKPVR